MLILLGGLAAYKIVQLIEALLPWELPEWVKLVLSVGVGVGMAYALSVDDLLISGLAMATLAGAAHIVLRLLTLAGDRFILEMYRPARRTTR